ncbi:hypothetical protein BpHYR1_048796 [Brachionus plicatilis]|uniref:Uncharacterized protein n=1 Tax=Brachionus plicatilis TaxID=10195 RepID=A0A3M7SCG6_BRAPC|nr:hypothetical protein BpHYR1_048796 [Brachionus plicatilis]
MSSANKNGTKNSTENIGQKLCGKFVQINLFERYEDFQFFKRPNESKSLLIFCPVSTKFRITPKNILRIR